jgi:mRNA interferase MazF
MLDRRMRTVADWKRLLHDALDDAVRRHDPVSSSALRVTFAAIEKASGARDLGPDDVTTIVMREIREMRDSAASYASVGLQSEAVVLDRQADVLQAFIGTPHERARTDHGPTVGTQHGRRGSDVNRGDVVWIAPEDPRATAGIDSNPRVVVQDDVFNRSRITTVVVCALSTNLERARDPGNVLLEAGEGGLAMQYVVVASQIAAVEKSRIGERIGSLSEERVDQILAGLHVQQT